MKTLHATGAYGRCATRMDWATGKDFKIIDGGPYFSRADVPHLREDGYVQISFYVNRRVKFVVDLYRDEP